MKARCVACGRLWGISLYQRIPKGGYVCPRCAYKKAPWRAATLPKRTEKEYDTTVPEEKGEVKDVR